MLNKPSADPDAPRIKSLILTHSPASASPASMISMEIVEDAKPMQCTTPRKEPATVLEAISSTMETVSLTLMSLYPQLPCQSPQASANQTRSLFIKPAFARKITTELMVHAKPALTTPTSMSTSKSAECPAQPMRSTTSLMAPAAVLMKPTVSMVSALNALETPPTAQLLESAAVPQDIEIKEDFALSAVDPTRSSPMDSAAVLLGSTPSMVFAASATGTKSTTKASEYAEFHAMLRGFTTSKPKDASAYLNSTN